MSDLTGIRFGRLMVTGISHRDNHYVNYWNCLCDCGTVKVVQQSALMSEKTRSCGCLKRELDIERSTKHGMHRTRVYSSWQHMKDRCLNPKNKNYKNYGGRGITICSEWIESFKNFYKDVGDPPSDKHQIDRKNNDGNYEPGNWRWSLSKENCRNTRTNNAITFDGMTKTVAEWAEFIGVSNSTLRTRLSLGWSDEKTLTTPVNHNMANRGGV